MSTLITQEPTQLVPYHNDMDGLFARFVRYLDAKPKTVTTYATALRSFGRYLSANKIDQPTREDVIAFRELIRRTSKANTVQLYIIALRKFFAWTATEGLYPDIAQNIKGAKLNRDHKRDALTIAQAKAILAAIDKTSLKGLRDYAMLALMITTGLRTIEVTRANVEDLRTAGADSVLYVQGKGRDEKAEYVKLSPPVDAAIRAYLTAIGPAGAGAPLFQSLANHSMGKRLTSISVSTIVKARMRAAGYDSDRLTAHSLRHTAVTLALMSGQKLEDVQLFARHASINTTLIYAHNITMADNSCAASVSSALF